MKKKILLIATIVLICAMTTVTVFATTGGEGAEDLGKFFGTFWSLVPPLIAIVLALITKEVYSSLFIGILAGALLHSNFNIVGTVDSLVNEGLIASVSGTAGIFVFLVILGIMVALINKTGGSAATVAF